MNFTGKASSLCLNVFRAYAALISMAVFWLMTWGKYYLASPIMMSWSSLSVSFVLLFWICWNSWFFLHRLGKTLQSITLLYTLLRQGFDGNPMVKKAIIVTPTSLVSNWEAEIKKWVGERVKLVALCESSRDDVISSIDNFRSPRSRLQVEVVKRFHDARIGHQLTLICYQVLIVSYETFRMHSTKFNDSGSCDLLICDEAHRLKNDQTLTNKVRAVIL